MTLHWVEVPYKNVTDDVTDFRLSMGSDFYPVPVDEIWWSATIDLRNTSIDTFEHLANTAVADALLIPNDYDPAEQAAVLADQLVTIYARTPLLDQINQDGAQFGVASMVLGAIVPEENLNFFAPDVLEPEELIHVEDGTVITAVIDDGIAFANNLFRSSNTTTRVEHVSILAAKPGSGGQRVSVGRALNRRQINRLLNACTFCGLLDEEQFYREAGLIDFYDKTFSTAALRKSHGTHAMGLATGFAMQEAPANRPIICAILPSQVTEDVSGQNLFPSLKLALKRLQRQASRFRLPNGERPPVVFNFSYGNFSGPHDGTGMIDRLLERFFGDPTKQISRIVLPAGNANLTQTHARMEFQKNTPDWTHHLDLMLQPDDRTASYVEIWMPYCRQVPAPKLASVRVTTPGGLQSGPVAVSGRTYQKLVDDKGKELARLVYKLMPAPTGRGLVTLCINPSASLNETALAPSGSWKISVAPEEMATDQVIDVWVVRDGTLPGFPPGGRQAYFNNPCYRKFDALGGPLAVDPAGSLCPVRRAGSLSGYACGVSPLVIGALTQSNGLLSDYSAAGPITPARDHSDANRYGPDATARGDDSPVLRGVLSAGSRSGTLVRQNGTSVSAPRVARFTADGLERGAHADRAWIWSQAEQQDHRFPGHKPRKTRTGGGRLDIPVRFGGRKYTE